MLHDQPHFVNYTRREKNYSLKKYANRFVTHFHPRGWTYLLTFDFVVIESLSSFKVIEITVEDFLKCTSIG